DMKKPYAHSLLSLATGKHLFNGSPLAFGEGNIKERIKNVLNYKKSSFWVIAVSMITVIFVGIALVSNPKQGQTTQLAGMVEESPPTQLIQLEETEAENLSSTPEVIYRTDYKRVKIEFRSDKLEENEFETTNPKEV